MISGFLREDVTDPTAGGRPSSSVDPIFLDWVNAVLMRELGPKLSQLPPQQYQQIVQALWSDPGIANSWNAYNTPFDPQNPTAAIPTSAQMSKVVADTLTSVTGLSDNPDLVQSFLTTKSSLGVNLTTAQRSFNTATSSAVPAPFAQVEGGAGGGFKFGDVVPDNLPHWAGTNLHMGTDYPTPAGEPIVAPFQGTVTVESDPGTYGNRVVLTAPDGSKMSFGHVQAGTVQGPVNPGEQIAITGENIGDSSGAVTLVEYQTPDGAYQDPATILDKIWQGTTFDQLGLGSAAGTGLTAAQIAERKYGIYDQTRPSIFAPEVNLFKQYFGREPTTAELNTITAGGKDAAQMEDAIRAMPSHIAGISVGTLADLRANVDKISMQIYGHTSNDSILKDVHDESKGNASPSFIQYFFDKLGFQPGREVDPMTYNAVYQAALPQSMQYYNQPPDQRDLKAIHAAAGSPGTITPSAASQVAGSAPSLTVVPDPAKAGVQ